MKPYPAYKPSGVPWLGDVPEHWEVKRIRFMARLNPGATRKLDPAEGVSFLPMEAVGDDGSLKLEQTRPVEEVSTGYTYFEDGDVTVAKITPCFENGKGANMQCLTGGVGFGTTELIVIRPSEGVHPQWLYLLTQSTLFRKRGEALMQGSGGQKRVPDGFIKDFPVAWPSEDEQAAIAAYLDAETARIDTLVAEKEKLIDLLGEYRQSVITEAVTKGLNPNAPMKPSGVTWLGDVPAHWDIERLKFGLSWIESGTSVNAADTPAAEGQLGVLKTSCVYTRTFRPEENKTVVPEDELRVSCPVRLDAVIVSRMNTPELVGAAGLVRHAPENVFLPDRLWQVIADQKKLMPAFLYWFTNTKAYSVQVQSACSGSSDSMQNLGQDKFRNFTIPLPPPTEQTAIAAHLDTQTAKIDGLIAHVEREIELLRELRSATITDAVLGRIDVRPTQELQGSPIHA